MTKEDKIKEAYGEIYDDFKMSIDENGWSNYRIKRFFKGSEIQSMIKGDKLIYRPKSLKGIENNNGWTALKGVKNEIQHDGDIWIFNKYGNVELWLEYQFLPIGYATHWKPIIKPNPPVW